MSHMNIFTEIAIGTVSARSFQTVLWIRIMTFEVTRIVRIYLENIAILER